MAGLDRLALHEHIQVYLDHVDSYPPDGILQVASYAKHSRMQVGFSSDHSPVI